MRLSLYLIVCTLAAGVTVHAAGKEPGRRELSAADHFLRNFERKVQRMRGQPFRLGYEGREALTRVADLWEVYPEHPKVKELFQRGRKALLASKGQVTTIRPQMLQYRRNEAKLKKLFFEVAKKEWDAYRGKVLETEGTITEAFPPPSWETQPFDKQVGKYVILEGFEYPTNEFRDSGRQYCFVGSGARGYYYVELSSRAWLGAYEAAKRYRRFVCSDMPEGTKWTVVGKITGVTILVPQAGKKKTMSAAWGWSVEPEAIWVPGRTFSIADTELEKGGRFAGEERMDEIKGPLYTVREIPRDASPERVVEIYATAIKEKNYNLYLDCIDPARRATPSGLDRCMYHWELHQKRFASWYCHIDVQKAKITVIKGFDEADDVESIFLTEDDKKKLKKVSEPLLEEAELRTVAYDDLGRQYGSPKPRVLRRSEKQRWYIINYPQPF